MSRSQRRSHSGAPVDDDAQMQAFLDAMDAIITKRPPSSNAGPQQQNVKENSRPPQDVNTSVCVSRPKLPESDAPLNVWNANVPTFKPAPSSKIPTVGAFQTTSSHSQRLTSPPKDTEESAHVRNSVLPFARVVEPGTSNLVSFTENTTLRPPKVEKLGHEVLEFPKVSRNEWNRMRKEELERKIREHMAKKRESKEEPQPLIDDTTSDKIISTSTSNVAVPKLALTPATPETAKPASSVLPIARRVHTGQDRENPRREAKMESALPAAEMTAPKQAVPPLTAKNVSSVPDISLSRVKHTERQEDSSTITERGSESFGPPTTKQTGSVSLIDDDESLMLFERAYESVASKFKKLTPTKDETAKESWKKALNAKAEELIKSLDAMSQGPRSARDRMPPQAPKVPAASPALALATDPGTVEVNPLSARANISENTPPRQLKVSEPKIRGQQADPAEPAPLALRPGSSLNTKGRGFADKNTNLEHELHFQAWPKPQARDSPAAQIRRVLLTNLPTTVTESQIASLVWGGQLEQISHLPGSTHASILFINPADCRRYFDETANGIEFPSQDSLRVVWCELATEVEPLSSVVKLHVSLERTRCLRVIGIDGGITLESIKKLACGTASNPRKLEYFCTFVNAKEVRVAEFRFCNIAHAVSFKAQLDRDEDFEACNVVYTPDPCAQASGVHLD